MWKPLYDQSGDVCGWVDAPHGSIIDRRGRHRFFLQEESVFDYGGRHVGAWRQGVWRNRAGRIVAFEKTAKGLILGRPKLSRPPARPSPRGRPGSPAVHAMTASAATAGAWAADNPLT